MDSIITDQDASRMTNENAKSGRSVVGGEFEVEGVKVRERTSTLVHFSTVSYWEFVLFPAPLTGSATLTWNSCLDLLAL